MLSDLPFIGPALFQQTALTFLAFALFAVVAFVLYRTPLGLAIRAVGENPAAVEAQGLDVMAIRIGAVVAGSALMALGGAFLTMSAFNAFFFEMTNGRGWICVALTVFASWRPGKALLGALLFGAFDAFQLRLQHQVGGCRAGPGVPDAALSPLDRGAGRHRAQRRLPEGADAAVFQRATLTQPNGRSRRFSSTSRSTRSCAPGIVDLPEALSTAVPIESAACAAALVRHRVPELRYSELHTIPRGFRGMVDASKVPEKAGGLATYGG